MSKKNLTEEEILEMVKSSNWENVIRYNEVPESIVRKYINKMNWIVAAEYVNIPEDLIDQHKHMFIDQTWSAICSGKTRLSEKFMRENIEFMDMEAISSFQKLSESFIEDFKEELDWYWIPKSQKLSKQFIIDNWERMAKDNESNSYKEFPFCIATINTKNGNKMLKEEYRDDVFILFLNLQGIVVNREDFTILED
jgi:hypothetical protein